MCTFTPVLSLKLFLAPEATVVDLNAAESNGSQVMHTHQPQMLCQKLVDTELTIKDHT